MSIYTYYNHIQIRKSKFYDNLALRGRCVRLPREPKEEVDLVMHPIDVLNGFQTKLRGNTVKQMKHSDTISTVTPHLLLLRIELNSKTNPNDRRVAAVLIRFGAQHALPWSKFKRF